MKSVAEKDEVVVVPPVVAGVDVRLAVRVVPVEVEQLAIHGRGRRGQNPANSCGVPSAPLPIEYSPGCISFGSTCPTGALLHQHRAPRFFIRGYGEDTLARDMLATILEPLPYPEFDRPKP